MKPGGLDLWSYFCPESTGLSRGGVTVVVMPKTNSNLPTGVYPVITTAVGTHRDA